MSSAPLTYFTNCLLMRCLPRPAKKEDRHGVLIIASGGLGDIIMLAPFLPYMKALAQNDEPITLLLRTDARGAAFTVPEGISIETYDWQRIRKCWRSRWATAKKLAQHNYRLVFSTDYQRHPFVDEFLMTATGAEAWGEEAMPSVKFQRYLNKNKAKFSRYLPDCPDAPPHRILRWQRLLEWALRTNIRPPPVKAPRPRTNTGISMPDVPPIILHPFSADHRRMLPVDRFLAILNYLPDDTPILLSAAPGDLAKHPEYHALCDDPRVQLDETPLATKARTWAHAALVITIDTVALHLATHSGAPTICFASAAYTNWSVPYPAEWMPKNVHIYVKNVPCKDCRGKCTTLPPPTTETKSFPCLAAFSTSDIVQTVAPHIPQSSQSHDITA
jgi:ADP-heptose:LPS heptosyltransferase